MSLYTTTPRWMPLLLRVAAVYNFAWCAALLIWPVSVSVAGGLPEPHDLPILRALAVIIGVFGIGYALAARDPVTHWTPVLMGLLGKLLVPLCFLGWLIDGRITWTSGLFMFTNEAIWWYPLAAILMHAARVQTERANGVATGTLTEELQQTRIATGESLRDLSFRQPVLIVFVRHLGCTFCREALADLRQQADRITQAGVQPVVVHMATPAEVQPMLSRYQLTDVAAISDPDRRLFRAFELPLGRGLQLFGPSVLWRALVEGVVFRYGFGRIVGNPLQLTGAFLVERGEIVRGFRSRTTAERTNFGDLACPLPGPPVVTT